jgi:hypothetical protein
MHHNLNLWLLFLLENRLLMLGYSFTLKKIDMTCNTTQANNVVKTTKWDIVYVVESIVHYE